MSKLFAFGCSNVYGVGLPDCWDYSNKTHTNTPSSFAWPQLLANKLEIECVNLSQPGCGNKEIWWAIVNAQLTKEDSVTVQWTFPNRHCILDEKNLPRQINYYDPNPVIKNYIAETYSEYDCLIETHVYIQHANTLVKNMYNFAFELHMLHPIPSWQTVNIDFDANTVNSNYPRALDGRHPGIESHKQLATEYLTLIKKSS